jgi:hypothetical protein
MQWQRSVRWHKQLGLIEDEVSRRQLEGHAGAPIDG